jgi:hypothetical protein
MDWKDFWENTHREVSEKQMLQRLPALLRSLMVLEAVEAYWRLGSDANHA